MTKDELKADMQNKFPIAVYWLDQIIDYVWRLIEKKKGK